MSGSLVNDHKGKGKMRGSPLKGVGRDFPRFGVGGSLIDGGDGWLR